MKRISRERLTLFPETLRTCSLCERRLPAEQFSVARNTKDGLASQCRDCNAARSKKHYRATKADNVARFAREHRARKYGLTDETFAAMVAAQKNRCAICVADLGLGKGRVIDHCHTTGRIRGLLCAKCNSALGLAGDDPERLRAMAAYVERYAAEAAA
jgi:hypothetical protein